MRKILAAVAVTALAAALAIPAFAGTKTVKVGDNYFVRNGSRPTVTIHKGSKLRFAFRGHAPHNVVKKRGPGRKFNSGVKMHGDTYTHRFRKRGTYLVVCTIHTGMSLNVKVK